MKSKINIIFSLSAACLFFTACQKEKTTQLSPDVSLASITSASQSDEDGDENSATGHVYTLSNAPTGNQVLAYNRNASGSLTFSAAYATGGTGTGGGLGNQGAVIITKDEEGYLLAVNAGSNSISSFKIKQSGLELKATVSSGGMRPVSVTQHENIVYVLNAGGPNNISGYKLKENGMLQAIPNSTRPLSAASTGPAEIAFINGGRVLVITEKGTNKIITWTVDENGVPGTMQSITSSSPTPFGFAVGRQGKIFVSEAVGGAPGASVLSSYRVGNNGALSLINGSIGAGQSAACWVVLTNNEKYAYATNTASANLTTFGISVSGNISVAQAISATTQAGPIDAALTNNSKYLYVLNGGGHSIQAFSVGSNGALTMVQTVPAIPVGATGLASN